MRVHETIIVGGGVAGLACARKLSENKRKFLLISPDIGGRIMTSENGRVNYGAYFVFSDFKHMLKYAKIKSRIRMRDLCFHKPHKNYFLHQPRLLKYTFQFMKLFMMLHKFKKHYLKLRKDCETISQKKVIEADEYLYSLYLQNAEEFVYKQGLKGVTDSYLSQALHSTTFSGLHEMNAFCFMQYMLPLLTNIYTFDFLKDKLIRPFKKSIVYDCVVDVKKVKGVYKVKTKSKIYYAKNIVLATPICFSKKFAGVKRMNKPVHTHMFHVNGVPRQNLVEGTHEVFAMSSQVQAMATQDDGTYVFYHRKAHPNFKLYFEEYEILAHKHWIPAGTINGNILIESDRGNNMYLIGDFNICGLEEAYVTGLFAANKIINS